MERTSVQKLAFVLKVLVIILLVCNIIALVLVPGLSLAREAYREGNILQTMWSLFQQPDSMNDDLTLGYLWYGPGHFFISWLWVWRQPYSAALALFLLACGICTAVILRQAWRVLDTVLKSSPFCHENAKSMKRAAVCCLLIGLFALARTVWSLIYYRSASVLLTYNTFFVPVFLMAGLLCMVISALFRQAAELKEDSDLTI